MSSVRRRYTFAVNGTKYTDPDFGALTWDSDSASWVGSLSAAELRIAASPRYMEVSDVARQTFIRVSASVLTARHYAATRLLELYNTTWNTGPRIDADAFIERIALESCAIDEDGSATLSYRDGDLFAGHYIVVSAEPNGDYFDASLCG